MWQPFKFKFVTCSAGPDYLSQVQSKIISEGGQAHLLSGDGLWFQQKFEKLTLKNTIGLHSFGSVEGIIKKTKVDNYLIEVNLLFNKRIFVVLSLMLICAVLIGLVRSVGAREIIPIIFVIPVLAVALSFPNPLEYQGLKRFFNDLKG